MYSHVLFVFVGTQIYGNIGASKGMILKQRKNSDSAHNAASVIFKESHTSCMICRITGFSLFQNRAIEVLFKLPVFLIRFTEKFLRQISHPYASL